MSSAYRRKRINRTKPSFTKIGNLLRRTERDHTAPLHINRLYDLENLLSIALVLSSPISITMALIAIVASYMIIKLRHPSFSIEEDQFIRKKFPIPERVEIRKSRGSEFSLYSMPFVSILILPENFDNKFFREKVYHELGHHKMLDFMVIIFISSFAIYTMSIICISILSYTLSIKTSYNYGTILISGENLSINYSANFFFFIYAIFLSTSLIHKREYIADFRAAYILSDTYVDFLRNQERSERFKQSKNRVEYFLKQMFHPSFKKRVRYLTLEYSFPKFRYLLSVILLMSIFWITAINAIQGIDFNNFSDKWNITNSFTGSMCLIFSTFFLIFSIFRNITETIQSNIKFIDRFIIIISDWIAVSLPIFIIGKIEFIFKNDNINEFSISWIIIWPLLTLTWILSIVILNYFTTHLKLIFDRDVFDLCSLILSAGPILAWDILFNRDLNSIYDYIIVFSVPVVVAVIMLSLLRIISILEENIMWIIHRAKLLIWMRTPLRFRVFARSLPSSLYQALCSLFSGLYARFRIRQSREK